jgi:hypothetical protein
MILHVIRYLYVLYRYYEDMLTVHLENQNLLDGQSKNQILIVGLRPMQENVYSVGIAALQVLTLLFQSLSSFQTICKVMVFSMTVLLMCLEWSGGIMAFWCNYL